MAHRKWEAVLKKSSDFCYSINSNETRLASPLLTPTCRQCHFSISSIQVLLALSIVGIFLPAEYCLGITAGTKEVLVRA